MELESLDRMGALDADRMEDDADRMGALDADRMEGDSPLEKKPASTSGFTETEERLTRESLKDGNINVNSSDLDAAAEELASMEMREDEQFESHSSFSACNERPFQRLMFLVRDWQNFGDDFQELEEE